MNKKIVFTNEQIKDIEDNLSHFQLILSSMETEISYLYSHLKITEQSIKKGRTICRKK